MIDSVQLTYALHPLPRGRITFQRWRWELWHGPQLLAAGWRLNPLHAQRALRVHAVRYAHRLRGLHAFRPEAAVGPEADWGGRPVTFSWGDLRVVLLPRPGLGGSERLVAATGVTAAG